MLKAIAGNDQVKVAIMNSGGASIIIQAVSQHIKQPGVSEVFVCVSSCLIELIYS